MVHPVYIWSCLIFRQDTERSQQSELATLVKEKDILQEKLDEALLERETLQAKVNFLLNQSDQGSAGRPILLSFYHHNLGPVQPQGDWLLCRSINLLVYIDWGRGVLCNVAVSSLFGE